MERLAQLPESLPGGPVPDYFVPGPGFEGEETAEELRERFSKDPSGAVPPPAPAAAASGAAAAARLAEAQALAAAQADTSKADAEPAAQADRRRRSRRPQPKPRAAQAAARAHLCGKQPVHGCCRRSPQQEPKRAVNLISHRCRSARATRSWSWRT